MVKTAILIGGYSRAGKSTSMNHLGQHIVTFSMSQEVTRHVKLLIPHLAQIDFTTDSVKAMKFPFSTAVVTNNQILRALEALEFPVDFWDGVAISRVYYDYIHNKDSLTTRDICIAVAESTRKILPSIYVDLVLKNLRDVDLVAIETIGGSECDYLYQHLKAKGYRVFGQNIRRNTELAGVDIRKLINKAQCDKLLSDVHNNYGMSFLKDYLNSVISPVRNK